MAPTNPFKSYCVLVCVWLSGCIRSISDCVLYLSIFRWRSKLTISMPTIYEHQNSNFKYVCFAYQPKLRLSSWAAEQLNHRYEVIQSYFIALLILHVRVPVRVCVDSDRIMFVHAVALPGYWVHVCVCALWFVERGQTHQTIRIESIGHKSVSISQTKHKPAANICLSVLRAASLYGWVSQLMNRLFAIDI